MKKTKIVNLIENIKEIAIILFIVLFFFLYSESSLLPYKLKNELLSWFGWGAIFIGSFTILYWFYSAAKEGLKTFLLFFIWLSSIFGTCIGLGFLAIYGVGANGTINHLYLGITLFFVCFPAMLYFINKGI